MKKAMKRFLCLVLAAMMVFAMVACNNNQQQNNPGEQNNQGEQNNDKKLKIGICVQSWTSNPIFIDMGNQIRAVAAEKGYELYENNLVTDTVITTLENYISVGCDIVIVQANQAPDAVLSMLPRFEEAGITVAIYDTDQFTHKTHSCVAYTASCDNYNTGYFLGKLAAEWANENIEGTVHAGVINRESNETFRFRAIGITDALNEYLNDGQVEASFESNPGTNEGGMNATEDLISAVPNMNLCCAWNGGSGVGAYEALKAHNWDGALFTIDASQDEIAALMNKDIMIGSLDLNVSNEFQLLFERTVEYVENGCQYPDGFNEDDCLWYFVPRLVTQDMAPDFWLS